MGLSSNILWHQTSPEGFYAILETKKLLFSYSLETIIADMVEHVEAFPMISLSELPFSELDFYLNCENYGDNSKFKTYGGYIIGFKRRWGIDNKFSPVWYCESYNEGLIRLIKEWDKSHGDAFLYYLIGNIKNTEGKLEKANADLYRFQNEREYRRLLDHGVVEPLSEKDYSEYKCSHGNSSLVEPRQGVAFEFDDIIYIIVPNEDAKCKLYSLPSEKRPNVPVFTVEEVNQNFIGIRHHHIKSDVDIPKKQIAKETELNNFEVDSIKANISTGPLKKGEEIGVVNLPVDAIRPWADLTAVPEAFKKVKEISDNFQKAFNPLSEYIRTIQDMQKTLANIYNFGQLKYDNPDGDYRSGVSDDDGKDEPV